VSRELRTPKGSIGDGDVRLAITASFLMVFFVLLSYFSFLPEGPNDFARDVAGQLFALTGLVVGFYFATTGALEYVRIRERQRERERGAEQRDPPEQPATQTEP